MDGPQSLLAGLCAAVMLAGMLFGDSVQAQTAPSAESPQTSPQSSAQTPAQGKAATAPVPPKSRGTPSHYLPNRFAGRAGRYYSFHWGIDQLSVKWVESGEMIRFSWHVLDAARAQVLNDKKAEPSLIDPQRGIGLVVPAIENVGQLRQTAPPESGRSYWITFSNKGRLVKRGDRINVVVGTFRADGLVVD
jgi:hypothetical protein